MKLSNKITEIFERYYEIVDDLIWSRAQQDELLELRDKANALIEELKMMENTQ